MQWMASFIGMIGEVANSIVWTLWIWDDLSKSVSAGLSWYSKPETTKIRSTWWLIPLSKWVITPVINGIGRVNPLITGVITHLLSGMSHQVSETYKFHENCLEVLLAYRKTTFLHLKKDTILQLKPSNGFLQILLAIQRHRCWMESWWT